MFQSHVGKSPSNLTKATRSRSLANASEPKASDDIRKERKNKYKIPKNLRYDLENALVSLCDVWFEEIKPYLVRNNVKVHVHDNEMNRGCDEQHCSVMDARRSNKDSGASSCLHLDPGAAFNHHHQAAVNSAVCCSTRPVVSRARSRRPAPPRPPPPSLRVPPLHLSQSPRNDNVKKTRSTPKEKKKKLKRNSSVPQQQHRIARPCRMPNVTLRLPNH